MKKFWLSMVVVMLIAAVCGFTIRNFCYRFPSEREMLDYHEAHSASSVDKISSSVDGDSIIFKVKHSNESGFAETYNVEAGKRWVMPWSEFNWKSE